MSTVPKLVIVGGGNMGSALLGGLVSGSWEASDLAVVEPDAHRQAQLREQFEGVAVHDTNPGGHSVLLAVKPAQASEVCEGLGTLAHPPHRLLSIVAGIGCEALQRWSGPSVKVLRAMPNMAAIVGASATAVCSGTGVAEEDFLWAEDVLSSVGSVVRVGETSMDAVTGVSGSGPAYLMVVVEAMIEAAVAAGLSRQHGSVLVQSTLSGAAALLDRGGMSPEAVRAAVTSPGGTTAAGLRALEDRAVRAAFMAAVEASVRRSMELGAAGVRGSK